MPRRAAERVPHANRRREHRPSMLEQEADVGGQSRSEREKQSEDHESPVGACRFDRAATAVVVA
jgi:hypothetical protein